MSEYFSILSRCLELGVSDKGLLPHLDDLLRWSNINHDTIDSDTLALVNKFGEQEFSIRVEELFDRVFIADPAGYSSLFPLHLDEGYAKTRYRQLIRLFHPDRGAKDEVWLNFRAERINTAYEVFQKAERSPVVSLASTPDDYPSTNNTQKTGKTNSIKFKYRPQVWRKRLGNPRELQKRIIFSIISIAAIGILFIYASTIEQRPNQKELIVSSVKEPQPALRPSNEPHSAELELDSELGFINNQSSTDLDIRTETFNHKIVDKALSEFYQPANYQKSSVDQLEIKPSDTFLLDQINIASIRTNVSQEPVLSPVKSDLPQEKPSLNTYSVIASAGAKEALPFTEVQQTVIKTVIVKSEPVTEKYTATALIAKSTTPAAVTSTPKNQKEITPTQEKPVFSETELTSQQIKSILTRFEEHYVAGELNELIALFDGNCTINGTYNLKQLRKDYKKHFSNSYNKKIQFSILNISDNKTDILINGIINVSASIFNKDEWNPGALAFTMVFSKKTDDLKIINYSWKAI